MTPLEAAVRAAGLRWDVVGRALDAATRAHEGQTRRDGSPYVVHPIRVALVALEWGVRDEAVLAAALLHDALEDTALGADEVERLGGPRTRELVELLTKPDEAGYPSKAERDRFYFERLRAGPPEAALLKCADRVDNLRDMAGSGWSPAKKRDYVGEARLWILPVARDRHPEAARRLEAVCAEVERDLTSGPRA